MAPKEKVEKGSFADLYKQFSAKHNTTLDARRTPSGSIIMDQMLGGGIPRGKLIEMYSKAGVGKTTLAKHMCEAIIKYTEDEFVVFLDVEKGLSPSLVQGVLAEQLGRRFAVFKISTFEEADAAINAFASTGKLALVVIDSITALIPQAMVDTEDLAKIRPGLKAQWESIFLNRQKSLSDQMNYSILFINQVRTKLNFRGMTTTTGSGGNALAHFVDARFALNCIKTEKGDDESVTGAAVEIKSIKNRLSGRGNLKAMIHLVYGFGVDNIRTYAERLIAKGYLKQAGSMFELTIPSLGISDKVKGKEAVRQMISARLADIEEMILSDGVIAEVSDAEAEGTEGSESSDGD